MFKLPEVRTIFRRIGADQIILALAGLMIGALASLTIFGWGEREAATNEMQPYHGMINALSHRDRVAPFSIINSEGPSSYMVKLVDVETDEIVMEIFVGAGRKLETTAPLGRYKLRTASGNDWVSASQSFGPLTRYTEAIVPLEFRQSGNGYVGVTVDLDRRVDGNLKTDYITPSQF